MSLSRARSLDNTNESSERGSQLRAPILGISQAAPFFAIPSRHVCTHSHIYLCERSFHFPLQRYPGSAM